MGLFTRKKTTILSPRRQRAVSGSDQPFRYYTSQKSYSATNFQQAQSRGLDRGTTSGKKFGNHGRRLFSYTLYGLFAVFFVQILILTPPVKVIVTTPKNRDKNNQTANVSAYIATANTAMNKSILNRNKITLNTVGIAADMQRNHPELENVVVSAPLLGSHPVAYVLPAEPVMRLETAAGSFVLTGKGYAYQDQVGMTTASLPRVIDLTGAVPEKGKLFLPETTVDFLQILHRQLSRGGSVVDALILPADAPFEVTVRLQNVPYIIRTNIQEPAIEQAGAANAVFRYLQGKPNPREYIDVRVPGKAYYR